jgi:hypothetical protein
MKATGSNSLRSLGLLWIVAVLACSEPLTNQDAAAVEDAAAVDGGSRWNERDGSSDLGPTDVSERATPPARLLLVLFDQAFLDGAFTPNFSPQSPPFNETWQRRLPEEVLEWSPILEPLRRWGSELTVVDGLVQHTRLVSEAKFQWGDPSVAATTLTGQVPTTKPFKWAPSIDWIISRVNQPENGEPLVNLGRNELTFGDDGQHPARESQDVYARLFEVPSAAGCLPRARPLPATTGNGSSVTPLSDDFARTIPMIVDAFRCDRTRTITWVGVPPHPDEIGPAASIQDCVVQIHSDGPTGVAARACMTRYGKVHTTHLAELAAALDAVPEGDGTMLDNTVIAMMGIANHPAFAFDTAQVILLGGRSLGLATGRYLNVARKHQVVDTMSGKNLDLGEPHNWVLVSLLNLFGVNATAAGESRTLLLPGGDAVVFPGSVPNL